MGYTKAEQQSATWGLRPPCPWGMRNMQLLFQDSIVQTWLLALSCGESLEYKKQAVSGWLRAEGITPSPNKEHWVWALGYLRDLEIRGYSDCCDSKLYSHNFIRQLLVLCLTFHKHRWQVPSGFFYWATAEKNPATFSCDMTTVSLRNKVLELHCPVSTISSFTLWTVHHYYQHKDMMKVVELMFQNGKAHTV